MAQQNLINQSFCSPSGTMAEIAVIRWLRELIGYPTMPACEVTSVWEAGGVTAYGGTGSHTTAMMLAREHAVPGILSDGVLDPERVAVHRCLLGPDGRAHPTPPAPSRRHRSVWLYRAVVVLAQLP
ncbi:hypothetical protein ABT025_35525 [Streptomyces sp. NPDC002809]|uniref:hypothetical protein n=1 Tax=Streptomyces sp. NPDC002809 TaxID=3154433 RepID=UPI00332D726A